MFKGIRLWRIRRKSISIDVRVWANERPKLIALREYTAIASLENSGFSIRVADFLANGMYNEYKAGNERYGSGKALRQLVPSRMPRIADYFDFESGTVASTFIDQDESLPGETEVVGVAGTISVMNELFGVTLADWRKIPVKGRLDFERFSNGQKIIAVEARGRLHRRNVSGAVTEIHKKKAAVRTKNASAAYPLLGVVFVPASAPNEIATCYICDPPIPPIEADPRKYRLLARLAFYSDIISTFSKSFILQALVQRTADLAVLNNYDELDGTPLRKRDGETWEVPQSFRTSLSEEQQLGIVGDFRYSADRESLLLFGLIPEVINVLAGQQFDQILRYRNNNLMDLNERTIYANVLSRELRMLGYEQPSGGRDADRRRVRLRGAFASTTSGIVFGEFLPDDHFRD